jgi:hypothetical protein
MIDTTAVAGMIMTLQSREILMLGPAVQAILVILNLEKTGRSSTTMVTRRRHTLNLPLGMLALLHHTRTGLGHTITGQQMIAGLILSRSAVLAGWPWMTGIWTEMHRVGVGKKDTIKAARNGKVTLVGTHIAAKIEIRVVANPTDGINLPLKQAR